MEDGINLKFDKAEFYDYIYNKNYKGQNPHLDDKPATETKLRLQALELTQSTIMDKIEENQIINVKAQDAIMKSLSEFHLSVKEYQTEMKSDIQAMGEKLDAVIQEKADKKDLKEQTDLLWQKKADMGVQKFLIWVGIVIGAGLLGYLGKLLLKVIEIL